MSSTCDGMYTSLLATIEIDWCLSQIYHLLGKLANNLDRTASVFWLNFTKFIGIQQCRFDRTSTHYR
jgi:hypothetical protein